MKNFEEKLSKISPNERRILQNLSIFWEQITAQEFQRLLKVLELKNPEGKTYSVQYVSLLRNSLIHKGILQNTKEYWGSGFQIADAELKEFFTREAFRENWFGATVARIQTNFPAEEFSRWYYNGERRKFRLLRDYRLSIYQKKFDKTAQLFNQIAESEIIDKAGEIIVQIFSEPFQKEFLGEFNKKFQAEILPSLFEKSYEKSEPTDELWNFVNENKLEDFPIIKGYKIEEMMLRGEIAEAGKLIGEPANLGEIISAATIAFLQKDYAKSVRLYEEGVKLWRKSF